MDSNIQANQIEVVETKIHQLSYFIRHRNTFDKKNVLFNFFKRLSDDEQYLVFLMLNEKQKLMLISKAGVLSPKVFEYCCKETDAYNTCICSYQLEDKQKLIKDWRKDYKGKEDFGKKIATFFAVLDLLGNGESDGQEKIKFLRSMLIREKAKSYLKKFSFLFLFLFCATNFILVGFIPGIIANVFLDKFLEMFFCASAGFLGIVKYSKLRESYLREDKLINMLSWISEFIGQKNELTISGEAKKLVEVSEKLAQNYDVSLPKIVPAKDNLDRERKSNWKTADKILKGIMVVLAVATLVSAFVFFFPLSFTFVINFAVLKIVELAFITGFVAAGIGKAISYFKLKSLREKLSSEREKVKQEKFSLDSITKVEEKLKGEWEQKKLKKNISDDEKIFLNHLAKRLKAICSCKIKIKKSRFGLNLLDI